MRESLGVIMMKLLLILCCGLLLTGFGGSSIADVQTSKRPKYNTGNHTCSVLGAIPYWAQDEASESFKKNIEQIDAISVFWYHIDPEGGVERYKRAREERALIELAHEHGVKVLALIANLPDDEREGKGNTWDPERVGRIIRSEERRAAHIADLVALSRRMDFDGIYIDYEALPGTYREDFTRFIRELGEALHAQGKLLAVAVHAKTSEDNPREDNGSHAQDWDALHQYADQLHFMTYSQHTASTEPGPVASSRWVERIMRYAVDDRKVPRAKVYMGVPLYAEEWRRLESGGYRGLGIDATFEDVQQRAREHDGTEHWSAEHESPYLVYQPDDGKEHIVWFEDERSSGQKLALAAELGVCNLSLWRLGGEAEGFWDMLRARRHGGDGTPAATRSSPESEGAVEEISYTEDDATDSRQPSDRAHDGYPRLVGDASAELEYYATVAAKDPEYERDNWVTNIDLEQDLEITPSLAVQSDLRVVLESDGEDERFYTDYPYEGVYVRMLRLLYETEHYSLFAGRYEPAYHIWGYAPIYFGNYSTNLDVSRRMGVGASATLAGETMGRHTLTGHAFYLDTSRLSGEVLTTRGRNERAHGGAGNTGKPNNFLVTLDGSTDDTGVIVRYTLGGGVEWKGDGGALNEQMYLGALFGAVPVGGSGDLELSVDLLSLRNAEGEATDLSSVGLGIGYSDWPLYIGAAYSHRYYDPRQEDEKRTDRITEVVARYGLDNFLVEAAYQNAREWGGNEHSLGIVLSYYVEWLVD